MVTYRKQHRPTTLWFVGTREYGTKEERAREIENQGLEGMEERKDKEMRGSLDDNANLHRCR